MRFQLTGKRLIRPPATSLEPLLPTKRAGLAARPALSGLPVLKNRGVVGTPLWSSFNGTKRDGSWSQIANLGANVVSWFQGMGRSRVVSIGGDRFLMGYANNAVGAYAQVVDFSTTPIQVGSALQISNSNGGAGLISLGTNKALTLYAIGTQMYMRVITVSGLTCSVGAETTVPNTGTGTNGWPVNTQSTSLTQCGTDKAFLSNRDDINGHSMRIITVSGSTPTAQTSSVGVIATDTDAICDPATSFGLIWDTGSGLRRIDCTGTTPSWSATQSLPSAISGTPRISWLGIVGPNIAVGQARLANLNPCLIAVDFSATPLVWGTPVEIVGATYQNNFASEACVASTWNGGGYIMWNTGNLPAVVFDVSGLSLTVSANRNMMNQPLFDPGGVGGTGGAHDAAVFFGLARSPRSMGVAANGAATGTTASTARFIV